MATIKLAMVYFAQGAYDLAASQLEKAVDVDPDYATARSHLGLTLYVRRNYEEAIIHLNKAIELAPAPRTTTTSSGTATRILTSAPKHEPPSESLAINPLSDGSAGARPV